MRMFLGLLICSASLAAGPTTRPRDVAPSDPPASPMIGQVVDTTRPAYVPGFVYVTSTSPLQTERDWAYQNTYPIGPWMGYYGYYGCYGYYPSWGLRGAPFHGFYR